MDVAKVAQVVFLMLLPSIIVGAALYAPRGGRAARRLIARRRAEPAPRPDRIPIELLAADLRRLLERHETLRRSTDEAVRARRLWALEAAIADCAAEVAAALGVLCPDQPAHGGMTTSQLRRLLRALVAAGLVLPPAISLLAADGRA
jgi:hypothetical protein